VIEEISPGREQSGESRAPDLIEPIVAFRSWRVVDGRLRSVYLPTFWTEREMTASCLCSESPDPDAARSARDGHGVPDRGCTCGIYAYYLPDMNFPTVDHQGVTGIVTVWGAIEVHDEGMRAEHARVEALAGAPRVAQRLGVEVVERAELADAAAGYGAPLPPTLLPHATGSTSSP